MRTSNIRQSSSNKSIQRIVVSLNIKVGNYSTTSEFTLTDRSHMQYPLLIGRTMIQDIAVVDVSRDHIQGRNKDTYLILNTDDYDAAMKDGKDPNAEYKAKRASAAGQIAYPSNSYGSNLGPNSENALPVVRNARNNADTSNSSNTSKSSDNASDSKESASQDAADSAEPQAKEPAPEAATSDKDAQADASK